MTEPTDTIILSVALASGRFKTELRVPLVPGVHNHEALEQWANLVQTGFKVGASKMDVTLERKDKANDAGK